MQHHWHKNSDAPKTREAVYFIVARDKAGGAVSVSQLKTTEEVHSRVTHGFKTKSS